MKQALADKNLALSFTSRLTSSYNSFRSYYRRKEKKGNEAFRESMGFIPLQVGGDGGSLTVLLTI